ncbi:MAG TPA: M23 family metallopeptidase [Polyangia bacterium]
MPKGACGMPDFFDTIDGTSACAMCEGALTTGRYVPVRPSLQQVFCSPVCLSAALRKQRARRWAARYRNLRRLTIGLVLLGACVMPYQWALRQGPQPVGLATMVGSDDRPAPPSLPAGWFGPEWPPTETSVLALLGRDAWIHPLAGPTRRMPRSDSRVFGAGRPGNRAVECRNGHCGVDLGGEIWGEHIRAVHDGVVDYVQRGANPDHGGRFVRISHHNGTVFTQYFHLAAIPRNIERGVVVKAGDLIGLLGDSGVKESQPHLHFSVSIRLWEKGPEKYMDPEPLIALWPLRVPIDEGNAGLVTLVAPPGVPLGSAPRRAGRGRKEAKQAGPPAASDAPAAGPDSDEPAGDTDAPEPSVEE